MAQTIVQYLIKRLNDLGVSDVFGVPGDYNFNILEAVVENPKTKLINCCNELNAGYAADGYARIKGMSAVITTFGVGELSAINAIAGAYTEDVPIVKIGGIYKKASIDAGKLLHHSLGDRDHKTFSQIYSMVTAHSIILSKENAQAEIEEALSIAYQNRKPVYIGIYDDYCNLPINITTEEFQPATSDESNLNAAIDHILSLAKGAKNPVVLSNHLIARYRLKDELNEFIQKSGFAASYLAMGKGIVDETTENYIGFYCGKLLNENTAKFIETSGCVLGFGVLMTDFTSGGFSAKIDPETFVDIQRNFVKIKDAVYENVYIYDVLQKLNDAIRPVTQSFPQRKDMYAPCEAEDKKLNQNYIYAALQEFLNNGDIFVTETGLTSFSSIGINLPKKIDYCNQVLWGSIGWATPAAFGACIAEPDRRVVLITGEGSHQMTAQEISSMLRYKANPIIIVINNDGYTIERLLCKNPKEEYNDLAKWDYAKLPKVFKGDSLVIQAKTQKEFYNALNEARRSDKFVYIEAFTEIMDASDFVLTMCARVSPAKQ